MKLDDLINEQLRKIAVNNNESAVTVVLRYLEIQREEYSKKIDFWKGRENTLKVTSYHRVKKEYEVKKE